MLDATNICINNSNINDLCDDTISLSISLLFDTKSDLKYIMLSELSVEDFNVKGVAD